MCLTSLRRIALRLATAPVLACALSGCAGQSVEPPRAPVVDAPINSLALEQCLKVNGPESCDA